MALIRWQPFHEMDALQRDMNRLFETLAADDRQSRRQGFMPLAEMEQTEDAIHLRVEVPGMSAEDLDVQVTKDAVTITGERKSQSSVTKNNTRRSEFRYGSFQRTIPLSVAIDNTQVTGNYQDGILDLELPLLKQTANKATKVKIGSSQQNDLNTSDKPEAALNQSSNDRPTSNMVADKQVVNSDNSEAGNEADGGGYGNVDVWNDPAEEKAIAN